MRSFLIIFSYTTRQNSLVGYISSAIKYRNCGNSPIWTARNNKIYLPVNVNPILRDAKPFGYRLPVLNSWEEKGSPRPNIEHRCELGSVIHGIFPRSPFYMHVEAQRRKSGAPRKARAVMPRFFLLCLTPTTHWLT